MACFSKDQPADIYYGGQLASTLRNQGEIAPQQLGLEQQYQPQYAQLASQVYNILAQGTNQANANKIYEHFKSLDIGMWSQKIGWQEVKSLEDVPNHHSQGHLFIGNHKP